MSSLKPRRVYALLVAGALSLAFPTLVWAQEPISEEDRQSAENAPLFASHDVIVMTLMTDLERIIDDRDEDREEQPATIRYLDAGGQEVELALQIEPRGNFRKEKRNCSFPPIRLNVRTGDMVGTVFEGEDKLKLVTPCREGRSTYQDYVFKEYLAYRVFNQITPVSFRVRLLDLTYEDSEGNRDPIHAFAFIIEDDERMAARHSATLWTFEQLHPLGADAEYAQTVAIFQYMIANTDWSPVTFHNIELIRTADFRYLAVPYDFDFAGLVDASYAAPDPEMGIRTVRDRLFRGFCREIPLEPIMARFNEARPDIEQIVTDLTLADESLHQDVLDFYEGFYRILNDPSRWRREVEEGCRALN